MYKTPPREIQVKFGGDEKVNSKGKFEDDEYFFVLVQFPSNR